MEVGSSSSSSSSKQWQQQNQSALLHNVIIYSQTHAQGIQQDADAACVTFPFQLVSIARRLLSELLCGGNGWQSAAQTPDLVIVAAADDSTPPARYCYIFAAGQQCRSSAYIVAAPAPVKAVKPSRRHR